MYGIFTNILLILMANVSKYTIDWSYGYIILTKMIQLISPGIFQASLFPNLEIPGRDWSTSPLQVPWFSLNKARSYPLGSKGVTLGVGGQVAIFQDFSRPQSRPFPKRLPVKTTRFGFGGSPFFGNGRAGAGRSTHPLPQKRCTWCNISNMADWMEKKNPIFADRKIDHLHSWWILQHVIVFGGVHLLLMVNGCFTLRNG